MPRRYTFIISGLTGLTAVPFAQLVAPATTGIRILQIFLGQEASEVSQQEVLTVMRRSTASTLPTATTPVALDENDPASLLTGSTTTNAQGIATVTGTAGNILRRIPFNALNGYDWLPTPESQIKVKPSGFLTLQFPTAPAANTWSGWIDYEETD
jgi:hypothetical protein